MHGCHSGFASRPSPANSAWERTNSLDSSAKRWAHSVSLCDDAANRARSRATGIDCGSASRDCPRTWLCESEPLHICISSRDAFHTTCLSLTPQESEQQKPLRRSYLAILRRSKMDFYVAKEFCLKASAGKGNPQYSIRGNETCWKSNVSGPGSTGRAK